MRLHQSATSFIALAASFAALALADYQGKLELDNGGCSIGADDTVIGFSANFYSYPYGASSYTDTNYYNGGSYATAGFIGSADLVPNPNFSQLNNFPSEHFSSLNGVDVPVTNFVMELFGYFKGMSLTLKFIFQFINLFIFLSLPFFFFFTFWVHQICAQNGFLHFILFLVSHFCSSHLPPPQKSVAMLTQILWTH